MATHSGLCSYGHSEPERVQRPYRQKCEQSTWPLAARASSARLCLRKSTVVLPCGRVRANPSEGRRWIPMPLAVDSKPAPGTDTRRRDGGYADGGLVLVEAAALRAAVAAVAAAVAAAAAAAATLAMELGTDDPALARRRAHPPLSTS
jgi:hypothetical protein